MYLLDIILHEAQTLDGNLVRPPLQQPLHPSLCRLHYLHGLRNICGREELEHANGQVEGDGGDDPRGVKVRLQCSGETVQAGRPGATPCQPSRTFAHQQLRQASKLLGLLAVRMTASLLDRLSGICRGL